MTDKIEIIGVGYYEGLLAARWTRNGVEEVASGYDKIPADVRAVIALLIAPELGEQLESWRDQAKDWESRCQDAGADADKASSQLGGACMDTASLRARITELELGCSRARDSMKDLIEISSRNEIGEFINVADNVLDTLDTLLVHPKPRDGEKA